MENFMDYSDSNKFEVAQFNLKNQFPFAAFVCERRGNVSTLVTTVNSVVKHVTDDLPIGTLCWINEDKNNKKREVFCDMKCAHPCAEIQITPNVKVNAIYVKDCVPAERLGRFFIVSILGEVWRIDQSLGPTNFREFVAAKTNDSGRVSCWFTPLREERGWQVVPCVVDPPLHSTLFEELQNLKATLFGDDKFFGVVIYPGKLVIQTYLVDCPNELEIGSTHICEIKRIVVSSFQTGVILLSSAPIKLDPKLVEVFVTSDANVLIRTVVGSIMVPHKKAYPKPAYDPFKEPRVDTQVLQFNFTQHPLFGDLYVSQNIIWSADSTSVIFCHIAKCHNGFEAGLDSKFVQIAEADIRCYILAIDDGNTMWRLPNLLETTFECVNALIDNGMKLKPGCVDRHLNESGRYPRPDLCPDGYLMNAGIVNIGFAKASENYCPPHVRSISTFEIKKEGYVDSHSRQLNVKDRHAPATQVWKTTSSKNEMNETKL